MQLLLVGEPWNMLDVPAGHISQFEMLVELVDGLKEPAGQSSHSAWEEELLKVPGEQGLQVTELSTSGSHTL
jgi:hypothetical protein